MNEREQLIEKLVTTMHLSVPERLVLSPNKVRYTEVAAVVARVLEQFGLCHLGARYPAERMQSARELSGTRTCTVVPAIGLD